MKLFSGRLYLLVGLSALVLAGCAAPEPKMAADGTTVAVVKCNRSAEAPLGSLIRKDCNAPAENQSVDKEGFMSGLQTPGSIPGRQR